MLFNAIAPLKVDLNYSQSVYSREGKLLKSFLNKTDKWRIKTHWKDVSPLFKKVILNKEDKYFYWHSGVNPVSVVQSMLSNIKSNKRVSGASTISMQVVRLLHPAKRTFFNKFFEMLRAFQLELKYSKEEILDIYINILPYGGNIEGVATASVFYFGKSPQALSLNECIILSIIPNKPTSLNIKKSTNNIEKSKKYWLNFFKEKNIFSDALIENALAEDVYLKKRELPNIAPHLSLKLINENKDSCSIFSSINYNTQLQCESILKNYVTKIKSININNGSIMVVENKTRKVIAYCGSNDFYDDKYQGQVNGIEGIRSPGSALKPFLYANAFHIGLYTPNTIVYDVPININSYQPQNYDKSFLGTVSVKKALAFSLNIPAVTVLNEMGLPEFISTLKSFGFNDIKSKNMGLSLALGGCGVTLSQLVTAYTSLSQYGKYQPLLYKEFQINTNSIQLLSPESVYLTTDILSTLVRPDIPSSYFNSTYKIPKIAWKTGTSFGRKDAWAIGYNKEYTIGVWVGNFTGEGVASLSGAEYATPLLFELFNVIDYQSKKQWFAPPKNIDYRYICPKTGHLCQTFCTEKITDMFIKNVTIQKYCDHVVQVYVNKDSSISYCNSCLPDNEFQINSYNNYPPNLINFYENEKISYSKIPPHSELCTKVYDKKGPIIVSPTDEAEYLIEENSGAEMLLNAQSDNKAGKLFWYINNKMVAEAKPNQPIFVKLPLGIVKISCSDDLGRTTSIQVKTKLF
mgnify:CR=1 FL=1